MAVQQYASLIQENINDSEYMVRIKSNTSLGFSMPVEYIKETLEYHALRYYNNEPTILSNFVYDRMIEATHENNIVINIIFKAHFYKINLIRNNF